MELSSGDIVRTRRGLLATVVSINPRASEGKDFINCSYMSCYNFPSLPMFTLKEDELFVVKHGAEEFWQVMFKQIKEEELREVVRVERAMRVIVPTPKEKVIRREKVINDLLAELDVKDLAELNELIKARKQ
jgi:hypothetical protein